jgi:hypothetical protein
MNRRWFAVLAIWAVVGTVVARAWQQQVTPCMACSTAVHVQAGGSPWVSDQYTYETQEDAEAASQDDAIATAVKNEFMAAQVANKVCAICSWCLTNRCARTVMNDMETADTWLIVKHNSDDSYSLGIEVDPQSPHPGFDVWICCGICSTLCQPY